MLEVRADVYEMTPSEASRYRREHRNAPDLPIPGKLVAPHPAEPEKAEAEQAPAAEPPKAEDEIPEDFTLPITKEGQSEMSLSSLTLNGWPSKGCISDTFSVVMIPDAKRGVFEALDLRKKAIERQKAKAEAEKAGKGKKPPSPSR